jgi:hypothetical protein
MLETARLPTCLAILASLTSVPVYAEDAQSNDSVRARAVDSPVPGAVEIEAILYLLVENVRAGAESVRSLARSEGATFVEELVEEATIADAHFTIQAPSAGADRLIAALERLGQIRSRQINRREMPDPGATEHRPARSVIRLHLASPRTCDAAARPAPRARIYPGVRFSYLSVFGGEGYGNFFGGGLSLRVNRYFGADVTLLRPTEDHSHWNIYVATMGGEVFSQLLGNGRRRFLNPYLGWRLGYGHFGREKKFIVGGSVGLELLSAGWASIDLATRLLGMVGDSNHVGVEPALSMNVAF